MTMSFSRSSTYDKNANYVKVVHPFDGPLLDVELNEAQDILRNKLIDFVSTSYGDGLFAGATVSYSSGTFTLSNATAIVGGQLINISTLTLASLVNGNNIYLDTTETTKVYTDTIKKYGNLQETNNETNLMLDSTLGAESSRRTQLTYTLTTTNGVAGHTYLLLGTITSGAFVASYTTLRPLTSGYLPLVGGTLTGALSGTSATLSSTLAVTGAITSSSTIQGTQLKSTIATGTAPFTVNSTTLVSNLNADMLDGVQATDLVNRWGYTTTASTGTTGLYTKIASMNITAQYQDNNFTLALRNSGNGGSVDGSGFLAFRVKQQNALGTVPYIDLKIIANSSLLSASNFIAVTTVNTVSQTTVELYYKETVSYDSLAFTPIVQAGAGLNYYSTQSLLSSLPTGTQTVCTQMAWNGDLSVTGNTTLSGTLAVAGATTHSANININGTDTADKALYFYKADGTTQTGGLRVNNSGAVVLSANSQMMYFRPNGDTVNTGQMSLDSTGSLSVAGSVTVGGPIVATTTITAPTAVAGTNTTQVATTAFVSTAIANLVASSPSTLNTLNELATALGDDPNFATTMTNALGLKAPLASPTFTGTVSLPTTSLTGHLYSSDGTERQIRSSSTLGHGFYVNSAGCGGYDWDNSRFIFGYSPTTNTLVLANQSVTTVKTYANTLDDGSGNMTIQKDLTVTGASSYGLNINAPTSSPWARGMYNKNNAGTTILGGIGGYGNADVLSKYYIGFGTTPWNSSALTVASGNVVSTLSNTLDDGSGNVTISGTTTVKGQLSLTNYNTSTQSAFLSGVATAGSWLASSVIGDTVIRNETNTDILLGFKGSGGSEAPALKLVYNATGASKVQTQRNTLDDGSGSTYITGAHYLTSANGHVVPASGGYVGFTNTARSKWGLKVSDNSAGNPQAYTNANTLDDGSGNMTVAGTIQGTQLKSTIATGTAPLVVASNTQVANLNATYLGGYTVSASTGTGVAWGYIPKINTDGVMEVGKYIDFHETSADGVDSASRLTSSSGTIVASGALQATSFASSVATGTAPLTVNSTTMVSNLNAQYATNLVGGSVGTIPYQTASGTTAQLAVGTSKQVLASAGASAPVWSSLDMTYLPGTPLKEACRVATTGDLGASSQTSTTLTGYGQTTTTTATTTAGSATVTVASSAGIKVGAIVTTATANLAGGTMVTAINSATSITIANLSSLTTVSITGTGSVATAVFNAQSYQPYTVGANVTISGAVPSTYNGTFTVTACTANSISWASTTTTTATTQGSITFNITAGSGVSTIFTNTLSALTIDGIAVATGDRVLVKNQSLVGGVSVTANRDNGIYTVTNTGSASTAWVLTRATDADSASELAGGVTTIDSGTTNGGGMYTCYLKGTDTIGTTAMPWYGVADNSKTLNFFAPTTSAQLASVISDESGSGLVVFNTAPTISSPTVSGTMTVATGGTINFANDTSYVWRGIQGTVGDNDYWRVGGGSSGSATNNGYLELATADDGTEPIYVRQYTGTYTTVVRTLTLLDASGNASFPQQVAVGADNGKFFLANNGCPASPSRGYGAIGQWYKGLGIQSSTNSGADTDYMFSVLTNDQVQMLTVKNGGNVFTKNNTMDDGAGNMAVKGSVGCANLSVAQSGDAIVQLEETSSATTTFRRKQIYSSPNIGGGNTMLFRFTRPSDGAIIDYQLGNDGVETVNTAYRICTTWNEPSLKSSCGYKKFADGLIIQWGYVSAVAGDNSFTFPIAFPTTVLGFLSNANDSGSPSAVNCYYTSATTGHIMSNITHSVAWIAIGY